jgi:hypothetical protein
MVSDPSSRSNPIICLMCSQEALRLQEPMLHGILMVGSPPAEFSAVAAACEHIRFCGQNLTDWRA